MGVVAGDVGAGVELERLVGHVGACRAVDFAADGKKLLSGSDDKSARFWTLAAQRVVVAHQGAIRDLAIKKTDDAYQIDWTCASGNHTGYLNNDEIPTELIPDILNGEAVIIVESYMDFVPFQDYIGLSAKTLTKKVVISPRFTSKLERDGNCA